jgi:hypothetical protein
MEENNLLNDRPKLGVVKYTYNPTTWEAEAGGWRVLCYSELHTKFNVSLGNKVRPCYFDKIINQLNSLM